MRVRYNVTTRETQIVKFLLLVYHSKQHDMRITLGDEKTEDEQAKLNNIHLYSLSPCLGRQAGLTNLSNLMPAPPLFRICSNATSFLPSPPGEESGRNFSCLRITFT